MDFLTKVSRREDFFTNINAIRGVQFGQVVYSAQTNVETALVIFAIDDDVQRELNSDRVSEIAKYIIERLKDSLDTIYFPPFVFSARRHGKYNSKEMKYQLKINNKMIVLDGQHRLRALERAVDYLKQYDQSLYDRLLSIPLSLQIYEDLNLKQERQLFSDINSNAVKVSANLLKYYSDDDLTAQMMREVINKHPIISYKDFEIRKNQTRKKLMTGLVVYKIIAMLDSGRLIANDKTYKMDIKNYKIIKKRTIKFLALLKQYMPKNGYSREDSIYLNQSIILGLAKICYIIPIDKWKMFFAEYVKSFNWNQSNTLLAKNYSLPYNYERKLYRLTPPNKVYQATVNLFKDQLTRGGIIND